VALVSGDLPRLAPAALAALPEAVARPAYDRAALRPGIVHLGLGAFMRAHLAVATEAALTATQDGRWGIVGVSLRHPDTRDALAPQDGLYTLALRDADAAGQRRERLQVVGCVRHSLVAPESPEAVLDAIAHPEARIVSLTVTEKGYLGPHALPGEPVPRSAIDYLVAGLARRRARGNGPVTLLSLDNLAANGHALQRAVLALARAVDPTLADWIAAGCTFPCSMVDRIVPRTTEADRSACATATGLHDAWPVVAEPFFDWAVEDRFAAGRPQWSAGGVRYVAEAAPWETLKLRMVNGAHSCIAYLGVLAGWATVDVAMAQPALRRHLVALMRDEIEPTLPALPGLDLAAYRTRLLQRFANPALAHRTAQIAMDGSQKLPPRWLGTVRERLAAGAPIERLGLGIAAWLHHLRGVDEAGRAQAIDDPQADALQALQARALQHGDATAQARVLCGHAPVFGDLAGHPALVAVVARHLHALQARGVLATLEALPTLEAPP
jgi:fructuronate reductase